MGRVMTEGFTGFPQDFFDFFRELSANNERAWFETEKPRYQASVQAPMSAFITAISPRLAQIAPAYVADPRPNGGSMFRIYRDVRFSKDKRPYKENAACSFRHERGKGAAAPGFYVSMRPGQVYFGGGLWMPQPDALGEVRAAIAARPDAWTAAIGGKAFKAAFGAVQGERLARPPRGYAADHPMIEDLRRKSFVATRQVGEDAAKSSAFVDEVSEAFTALSPMMRFLCGAVGVEY
jgi:uncharacterized protein (TIGR02453 family)